MPSCRGLRRRGVKAASSPQSLALRSRIVLAAAESQSNQQIAAKLSVPQITASKWRRRFASHGLEGLRDAPCSGRPVKHGAEVWQKVQHRVCQQPKFQSRWSVRTLARLRSRTNSSREWRGRHLLPLERATPAATTHSRQSDKQFGCSRTA
jgi:transposase